MILRNLGDWENERMIWRALEVRELLLLFLGGFSFGLGGFWEEKSIGKEEFCRVEEGFLLSNLRLQLSISCYFPLA